MTIVNLHLDIFGSKLGGSIRCDQGGELVHSPDFVSQMALRKYTVEPIGADDPAQNKAAEKWNDVLAVNVRVLLYRSGLPASYFWSAALLHAVWLHNRRVHRSILKTPFEAWHGVKPDLGRLWVFGSRVCVKQTGKCHSKLDCHDFTGIFLGYTATDKNICYVMSIQELSRRLTMPSLTKLSICNRDVHHSHKCFTMYVLNLFRMSFQRYQQVHHPKPCTHQFANLRL